MSVREVLLRYRKDPRVIITLPIVVLAATSLIYYLIQRAKELSQLPPGPAREQVRWMLEELRVSLFAPSVKAKGPISLQRIYKAVDAAR